MNAWLFYVCLFSFFLPSGLLLLAFMNVVILVLVKNDGDDAKRNPLEEFARPCRNPFAIKKPLFGKDNDTPKKEQSISQIISGMMTKIFMLFFICTAKYYMRILNHHERRNDF